MQRSLGALLTLASLVLAVPAAADWPAQGRRILVADGFCLTDGAWIFDLPSGDLLVRAIGNSNMSPYFNVQRATPTGEIASGWPAAGVSMGYGGRPTWHSGFAIDRNGFAWQVACPEGSCGVHAVDAGGVLDPPGYPLWALSGVSAPYAFVSAPNGIYAYFNNRVQRFTEAGTVASGWPAGGVLTNPVWGDAAALPDGSGGVVTMAMATALGPRTLRFDSSGVKHGGPVLSNDPDDTYAYDLDVPPLPALVPSDASHYFAVWSAPAPDTGVQHVKVQRAGYDNALAPGWPTAGMVAVAPHKIFHVTPLSDHAGGLYLVWYQDDGLPRATHVRADGTFVPGTDANGVVLFPPGPLREPQEGFAGGSLPYMVADVTPDGRLLFAWDDAASGNGIRVRWLLSDLTSDPSEPVEGRLIMPNPQKTVVRAVHAAPDGGAYVAWDSEMGPICELGTVVEIWMTRLLPSSLVGVAPQRPALALSAPRPNPARSSVALDVTLPDDSPARVELIDVAGRVVRSQAMQGSGAHAIAFDGLAALSPGLYFARIRGHAGSVTTCVIISR